MDKGLPNLLPHLVTNVFDSDGVGDNNFGKIKITFGELARNETVWTNVYVFLVDFLPLSFKINTHVCLYFQLQLDYWFELSTQGAVYLSIFITDTSVADENVEEKRRKIWQLMKQSTWVGSEVNLDIGAP